MTPGVYRTARRLPPSRRLRAVGFGLVLFAAMGAGGTALGQNQGDPQSVVRGETLANRDCAACHSIEPTGASPLAAAPPFRDLHKRFPPDDLEAGVLSDLLSGHPAMPEFRLRPAEIHDLLMYLRSVGSEKSARAASALEG